MADLTSYIQGFDLDSGGGTDLVQGHAIVVAASGGAVLIGGDAANGLDVDVTRVSGTVTVDTELAAAAALADGASAAPTTPTVGAIGLLMNATTVDRQRAIIAGLDSNGIGIAAAGLVGQRDDASTTSVTEDQFAPVRISSRRAMLVEGVASGTSVNVNLAASGITLTVDTELPNAAALADATANPTVPGVGGFMMGYNGTTWDRVRTANTGRLQVDVVTGGGADTPTNPVVDPVGATTIAAGATSSLTGVEAAAKKLRKVIVWGSAAYKATVHTVDNGVESGVKALGGGQPFMPWTFETPHRSYVALGTTAGNDRFRVNVTNLDDTNSADFYATFYYED